jgi:phosphate transport system substrate-binding protein
MRKVIAFALAALMGACACGAALANTTLVETGSTLMFPLMQAWATEYARSHSSVQIETQGTGSAMGISQAISGVVQIGASDAYLKDAAELSAPMLNIPLAISAQQVNYNLPGVGNASLNLSGPVLAGIYSGAIKYWDDAAIKGDNKGAKLPHNEIVPIHRADGSGDTFLFTQYLSKSTPSWAAGPGFDTTVNWPSLASSQTASGNKGMLQVCSGTPYSIAYIGISYLDEAKRAGLGVAALRNADGKFVEPNSKTVASAANAFEKKTPADERISLVFAPGTQSYPIVNYEYAIVNPKQVDSGTATELKKFLEWALSGGQNERFLGAVRFLPLPSTVVKLSRAQISKIQ